MGKKVKKNPKGGKKHKQKAAKDYRSTNSRNVPYKNAKDGQMYATVLNRLGGNRLAILNDLGLEIQGVIPGRFRKKVWFNTDDIILIQSRSFNEKEFDVIYKYTNDESKILKGLGHLDWLNKVNSESKNEDDLLIDFTNKIEDDCDDDFNNLNVNQNNTNTSTSVIDFDDI